MLQALRKAWSVIAPSRDNFRSIFATEGVSFPNAVDGNGDPLPTTYLVDLWYDYLCPDGNPKHLTIDSAFVHGQTKPPSIIVASGSGQQEVRTLAQNTKANKPTLWHLKHTVTLTLYAPLAEIVDVLGDITVAMLGMSTAWLIQPVAQGGAGYREPDFGGIRDLEPLPAIANEKFGMFRKQITWTMLRDHAYAPLLGSPSNPAYLSLHHFDAVDLWGNHGRAVTAPEE